MPTNIYRGRVETTPNGERHVYEERVTNDTRVTTGRSRYAGIGFLYLVLDVVEVLLALRLLFGLLGASLRSPFVAFIYQITAPLVAPFRGAFAPTITQGTVIEWSTVLAMIVYALIVYGIVRLMEVSRRAS